MKKRLAGTGLAIGLVAGAGAGLVLELSGSAGASPDAVATAASDTTVPDTTPTEATTPDSTTEDPNMPADAPVPPDRTQRLQEILQPLVDDGTITQEQADKVIAALEAAKPDHPKMGGRHILMGPGGFGLDVVATTLGITTDDVIAALKDGQSLADLAVSKGKTAQDVIDAIVTEATTRINEKVAAGGLTQDEADKIIADITERVTDFVNNTPAKGPWVDGPKRVRPWMGGPGFGHGRDFDGDSDDAPADTTETTVVG
jgi:polyhydroxyalkanoate synthesis regulator phasin